MAELLQIDEPAAGRAAPQWRAFLELGFRPLYLVGAAWGALSVALWIGAPQWLGGAMAGVIWHAHEMLWGFIGAIAVGFLLTAAATWTGVNPLRGAPLAALAALWLAARAAFLLPGMAAFWTGVACELLFFAWAAAALGRAIYRRGASRRNDGVPLLVLGLGAADALYLLAARAGDYPLLLQRFNAGLLCMAVIALLIARRIIPFFAMRAIAGLQIPMHTRSGQWQLAAGLVAVAATLAQAGALTAVALAAAGLIALAQWLSWRPWATRGVPLLWILYAGYLGLAAGLLVAAASAAGGIARAAWPAHVIGMAGFGLLIIGMITRTALGHLGRPLRTDRLMLACYLLVIGAAALRLAALWPGPHTLAALHGATAAWVLAFVLYLWRFAPLLVRPRLRAPTAAAMPVRSRP
ncbi:NnrS family protein [Bordetella parapertussis]|uniref:Membrane protein n=79 Tax=Bordetella TaxID=517 RepID=K0M963_BORPB|nr:NnrS family protein [Bordetella parapertussis]CCJ49689.1 putative membrane protein [Bordetella parapertussis Bpp5]